MRRARYLGRSQKSLAGWPRKLEYGEIGFVDDSDPRGIRFFQPRSGCFFEVQRHEVEFLQGASLDWRSKVVLALLGIAACFGLGFAAAMIGGWFS